MRIRLLFAAHITKTMFYIYEDIVWLFFVSSRSIQVDSMVDVDKLKGHSTQHNGHVGQSFSKRING